MGPMGPLNSRDLLRTLELVTAGIAVMFWVLLILGAGWISTRWLRVNQLPTSAVAHSLILMGGGGPLDGWALPRRIGGSSPTSEDESLGFDFWRLAHRRGHPSVGGGVSDDSGLFHLPRKSGFGRNVRASGGPAEVLAIFWPSGSIFMGKFSPNQTIRRRNDPPHLPGYGGFSNG